MSLISSAVRAELVQAYEAPDRHYHDLRHIEALLGLARAHADALSDRDAVEAAIWFHDAIYDTRRNDNEAHSAELAVARLSGAASPDRIAGIAAMIRATSGHVVPDFSDPHRAADCALFLDMDLAILGATPVEFAAYEQDVRREYAWVPEPQWVAGRRHVLEMFLARPAIFATVLFRDNREAQARDNLTNALAALMAAPSRSR
jgi:predicted metal-dependent HD superfamily phosphohydrolase